MGCLAKLQVVMGPARNRASQPLWALSTRFGRISRQGAARGVVGVNRRVVHSASVETPSSFGSCPESFVASASEIATEELIELESHVSRRFCKQSLPSLAAYMASEQAVVALMASEQTVVGAARAEKTFPIPEEA